MIRLVLLMLSVCVMAYTPEACEFGSDAIQEVYDRFELFKQTKAFDPANSTIPLEKYFYNDNNGEKAIALKINGVYMLEYYKTGDDNEILTKSGQYQVRNGITLNYTRNENGEFSFDDRSNGKKFESSLRSIDADLPDDFEADYKNVLIDLNAMRKKMFDYQHGLSKEDFERVIFFEYIPFSEGGSFGQYTDKKGGILSISKDNESGAISGRLLCNQKDQKYNIVDGKVVADGEPFARVYN
ncbi:hypothetical protein Bhyg_07168 [Pseudolycoriella hygida]|uniref:Uncharacterized protein n=1 Tax=Pseudolycoriella hygida TaxID=35572 RepID=A0A9Q0N329_9DIPT|nr:hypothetical protein Bhyg_07168 [Pseudolycoriella hygida]